MRFGSCLAIGISCAGTGSREAMDVLEPMMEDVVDFVRQVRDNKVGFHIRNYRMPLRSLDKCLCSDDCFAQF